MSPSAPSPSDALALDPSPATLRRIATLCTERIIEHLASLPSQPMHTTRGGHKLALSLREPLPEEGTALAKLLRRLFGQIIPASLNTASAGYFGYIPSGGIFSAAVADFIAAAVNRYTGVFQAAPGLVQIESNVITWLTELAGLPPSSFGLLTTGGSIANWIALFVAKKERLPPDFLRGVVYTSDQAHHSVHRAANLLGLLPERVRIIPSNARFRIQLDALAAAIVADKAQGLLPFAVVGQAGSTNTGAIDDLMGLSALCHTEGLWLHIDAAYGGFFRLTERGREALRGLEQADSITLDPHKSLFLPYGNGCLLVRDRTSLRRAFSMKAEYLPPMQTNDAFADFCELSPELSREARGLRLWLPLKLHGASAFRRALDEKLSLARAAVEMLRPMPFIEIVAEPELSLFAFRVRPPGETDETRIDRINRTVLARINEKQRVFLTGTTVHGRFVLRLCVLSFRTQKPHIVTCIDDITRSIREVIGQAG